MIFFCIYPLESPSLRQRTTLKCILTYLKLGINRSGIEITALFQLVRLLETESKWLGLNHKTVGVW